MDGRVEVMEEGAGKAPAGPDGSVPGVVDGAGAESVDCARVEEGPLRGAPLDGRWFLGVTDLGQYGEGSYGVERVRFDGDGNLVDGRGTPVIGGVRFDRWMCDPESMDAQLLQQAGTIVELRGQVRELGEQRDANCQLLREAMLRLEGLEREAGGLRERVRELEKELEVVKRRHEEAEGMFRRACEQGRQLAIVANARIEGVREEASRLFDQVMDARWQEVDWEDPDELPF